MAMTTMKDHERLDLLKEIGGTKVYEERILMQVSWIQECLWVPLQLGPRPWGPHLVAHQMPRDRGEKDLCWSQRRSSFRSILVLQRCHFVLTMPAGCV